MQRFKTRCEHKSDFVLSCFQLLNEQRKREALAVEQMELQARHRLVERTKCGGWEIGANNYGRGKFNWMKNYIVTDDIVPTYPAQ